MKKTSKKQFSHSVVIRHLSPQLLLILIAAIFYNMLPLLLSGKKAMFFLFFFLAQFVLSLTEPSWRTFKAPQKSRIRTKTLLSRVNRSLFGGVIGSRSWKWLSKWVCSGITSSVELRRGGSGGRWGSRLLQKQRPSKKECAPLPKDYDTAEDVVRGAWEGI